MSLKQQSYYYYINRSKCNPPPPFFLKKLIFKNSKSLLYTLRTLSLSLISQKYFNYIFNDQKGLKFRDQNLRSVDILHKKVKIFNFDTSLWAFTCSKLTIETLEQGMKYVQI